MPLGSPANRRGGKDHGEAPFPVVLALGSTALATLAFFFFNQPVLDLESQLVENLP